MERGGGGGGGGGGTGRPRTALNECVKVVVRCRPLSDKERADDHHEVPRLKKGHRWNEPPPTILKKEDFVEVVKVWSDRGTVQVLNPKGQDKMFTYDAAYDSATAQQTIYDEMVRPLVASVLDGFNGCVFAYGQTGTGKTYTMEGKMHKGSAGDEGIIPRTFHHIWNYIENGASQDITYLVSCSYVELYLEDIRDLLRKDNSKKALTIRGQELSGFYIPDMTSVVCRSAADMMRVMRAGNKNRTAGRTDMNEHSSRSHAVFLVTVETAEKGTDRIRVGKLNLVDLAGSERQRKTGASAERLREASRINQALSSLGNVISALAENSPHIPYRDSKLTRILQDSLGGNSKTIMIANIGPASYNYDETITTLRYAHRAKAIKNKPVRNEDPKDAKLREYQEEISRLRKLIEERKAVEKKREKARRPVRKTSPTLENQGEDDALSIDNENMLTETESTIEAERGKTSELESQIQALEDRLVSGGGGKDIINDLNESQLILEQRNQEIAERKKREVEMQQKIDLEEETTTNVTNTFTTLQQEVDHKTQRLKKCLAKYTSLKEETIEQREAHDSERREQEAAQASLIAELRRRLLLADSFVPEGGRALVLRVRYNEEQECWEVPPALHTEPMPSRPLAAPGRRRPTCEAALQENLPRHRCENLLDLRPIPLPTTTREYKQPKLPQALQEVMNSALKEESDIEIRKPSAVRRPTTAHHKVGVR